MKVFLAGIIQGSIPKSTIHNQDWRGPIREALSRHLPQAEVYCHYSCHPASIDYEMPEIRATLSDGIEKAAQSDLVVAFVPSASMGTALEIYEAYRRGAAVVTISPLSANWVLRVYSDALLPDMAAFEDYLSSGSLQRLLESKKRSD
ncbi:MAG: hypothetical protein WCU88_01975 [Elusimicrobiota bacterium]|jgi:hypothetical protein